MNIVILSDNTSTIKGLDGEHGFSAAIYLNEDMLWLWDAGASDLAARNARSLGVNISKARGLALSHGHYDHTGGVEAFLESGFSGSIYAHPASVTPRWSVKPGRAARSIGWQAPQTGRERLHPVRGARMLAADAQGNPLLTMVTDIPRLQGNVENVQGFFHDEQATAPDNVIDDACLVLHTLHGRVLVLGCCHSGLANTLAAADAATANHTGSTPGFACVLGGLHLLGVEDDQDERILQVLTALARYNVRSLRPGHCTGGLAMRVLADEYEGDFQPLRVGENVRF